MSKEAARLKVIRTEATAQGFHAVSVVSVPTELRREYYLKWLAQGKQGSMEWMGKHNERRLYPERLLPQAASILVLAMNYYQADPPRPYRIAKYALGDDYHNVIYRRLKKLCRFMGHNFGSQQKPYVDTGPLLEKPLAEAAGLGWQGKSTILIEPKRGTWSFSPILSPR
jgi:epoxyqueuosine reductase